MSARDEILARVRANLAGANDPVAPRGPLGAPEPAPRPAEYVTAFRAILEAVGGRVHVVPDEAGAAAALGELLVREGARSLVVSESPRVQRVAAAQAGVEVAPPVATRETLLAADVGLTGALLGIVETGTLVLSSDAERSREVSLLPSAHVALLDARDLVATLEDALARLDTADLPRAVTFVTGPSRTADIELTLVVGVHGPKTLDVILIDAPGTE